MDERLVDVLDCNGTILHTYPVTLDDQSGAATDEEYKAKALEAAAQGRLVPDNELRGLSAKMHQSRSGRMQPPEDQISTNSETKIGLEQAVRERAYLL